MALECLRTAAIRERLDVMEERDPACVKQAGSVAMTRQTIGQSTRQLRSAPRRGANMRCQVPECPFLS